MRKVLTDILDYLMGSQRYIRSDRTEDSLYAAELDFVVDDPAYRDHLDSEGVPLRQYVSAGIQYNPTRIAGYGLANWDRYVLSRCQDYLENFLAIADWFVRHPSARWDYKFRWLDLDPPWISAMAQGQAASVLTRAFSETRRPVYREYAIAAMEPFFRPSNLGGVAATLEDGSPFLEEYPTSAAGHVLNGHLIALIGLMDVVKMEPRENHQQLLYQIFHGLNSNIHRWSLGKWSAYDLLVGPGGVRNASTPSYHNLHIALLQFIVKESVFNGWSADWANVEKVLGHWKSGANLLQVRSVNMFRKTIFRIGVRPDR